MNVALIGTTGNVGSRLLAELLRRGHTVTAIARNPERVPAQPGVTSRRGDVADKAGTAALLAGHDAAISAVRFTDSDPRILIDAVKAAGVPRYLVVGGAGSLEAAPGLKLVDAPGFPATHRPEALGALRSSMSSGPRPTSTGPSSRRRRCSSRASAPASSASAATNC
jgi:uncharacterized protein